MNKFIMVWDPSGEIPDGTIYDAQNASALAAKGCVLLPTDTSVHRDQALGACAKRSWGTGLPADDLPGLKFTAPVALYGEPIHTKLSWAIRIRPSAPSDVSGALIGIAGQCSMNPLPGQRGAMQLGFSPNQMPVALVTLGAPDEFGGWTLKGSGDVSIPTAGFFAFAVAGAMMGVRVMWSAVAFSKE